LYTIETGKIREGAFESRLSVESCEMFGGENAKIEQFAARRASCGLASEIDHARRNVASNDGDAAASEVNSIEAGAAVELQNATTGTKPRVEFAPDRGAPKLTNGRSGKRAFVFFGGSVPEVPRELKRVVFDASRNHH
jgi:hypothetical protein